MNLGTPPDPRQSVTGSLKGDSVFPASAGAFSGMDMTKTELMQLARLIAEEMTPMLSKHWKDSPELLGAAFKQIETLEDTIENAFAEVECLEEIEAVRVGKQQLNDYRFRIGA